MGHASTQKCAIQIKETKKKKRLPSKNFLMEGRNLYGCIRRLVGPISMKFGSMNLHTYTKGTNSLVMSESAPNG